VGDFNRELFITGGENMKRKVLLVFFTAMLLCTISYFPIGVAFIQDDSAIVVDVLLVGDEEFMSQLYYMGLWRWVPASQVVYDGAMPVADECFYNEFKITFYWGFGWRQWDSDDATHDPIGLLNEAISEVGFQSGMIFNGRHIDILMVWTGQDMGQAGYSPPWLNACICSTYLLHWLYLDNVAQHELSHQFNCAHCGNGCIMNPTSGVWEFTNSWCANCKQTIDNNKFKFPQYLSISASAGGITNPYPGTYTYYCGSSVTVTATASSRYVFSSWLLDGATRYDNPITVTMDSDHTLTAYFQSSGGGSCPTLFVWNGTSYVEEGILNIHAESDVTVQHTIQNTLVLKDGFYNLQLRELDNYTSHIDQVKLYAVDSEGEWHLCPLTYAYHSELGKVTWKLRFDDSNRVDLEPTEIIDLKFAPSIPYSETAYFIFEINGYNLKPMPI
jgi:hypothetical protein